ncbi:MAG: FAD-binding oxidoreductase [Spirochaetaceae bacterium]|nr:MAG: FAD-binding oxidoreductase [Spirochaetaceae bacterium]
MVRGSVMSTPHQPESPHLSEQRIPTGLPSVSEDPEKIRNYLSDESAAMHGSADAVFFPTDANQVSALLLAAQQQEKPVTISAGGTSITGSRVPTGGGWVLSVERMRDVQPVAFTVPEGYDHVRHGDMSFYLDVEAQSAIAPVGITLTEFAEALARFGLAYPPDPTEMTAMLGGTVATNASGARSYHYRPTRSWIRALEVVLPTGGTVWLKRGEHRAHGRRIEFPVRTSDDAVARGAEIPTGYPVFTSKNAAGLYLAEGMDLVDLFVGSEGILGVITAVQVELVQIPRDVVTTVAFFRSVEDTLSFVALLRANRAETTVADAPGAPLSLEYFDRRALGFMRGAFPEIPRDATGAVLFEFVFERPAAHNPYPDRRTLRGWQALLGKHNARADWSVTREDSATIRQFRHALPEAVNAWVRARVGKLGTDMAVPPRHFRRMLDAYRQAEECGVQTVCFGHIGDCHLHLNFLPEDNEQLSVARSAYRELAQRAVELGGTISAEHGVGKKSIEDEQGRTVPYLEMMLGREGLRAIHTVKRALDPGFILNRGNMVPQEYR